MSGLCRLLGAVLAGGRAGGLASTSAPTLPRFCTQVGGEDTEKTLERRRSSRLLSETDEHFTEKVEAVYPTTVKQRRKGARVLQALFDVIEKDGRLYDLFFDDLGVHLQDIRVSPDGGAAYIRWSAKPGSEDRAEAALGRSAGFLRRRLARTLPYRRVPSLVFVSDYLTEEEARLEDVFDQIAMENEEARAREETSGEREGPGR